MNYNPLEIDGEQFENPFIPVRLLDLARKAGADAAQRTKDRNNRMGIETGLYGTQNGSQEFDRGDDGIFRVKIANKSRGKGENTN